MSWQFPIRQRLWQSLAVMLCIKCCVQRALIMRPIQSYTCPLKPSLLFYFCSPKTISSESWACLDNRELAIVFQDADWCVCFYIVYESRTYKLLLCKLSDRLVKNATTIILLLSNMLWLNAFHIDTRPLYFDHMSLRVSSFIHPVFSVFQFFVVLRWKPHIVTRAPSPPTHPSTHAPSPPPTHPSTFPSLSGSFPPCC